MFLFFYYVELTFGGRQSKVGGDGVNKQILSCAKVAILLLQDLSTLYVTDIYGIYCVISFCNTINLSHHEHV